MSNSYMINKSKDQPIDSLLTITTNSTNINLCHTNSFFDAFLIIISMLAAALQNNKYRNPHFIA